MVNAQNRCCYCKNNYSVSFNQYFHQILNRLNNDGSGSSEKLDEIADP
ncbi:hypothetical protein [Methanobrevibacter sp.]